MTAVVLMISCPPVVRALYFLSSVQYPAVTTSVFWQEESWGKEVAGNGVK
jgi:hypothetical protein